MPVPRRPGSRLDARGLGPPIGHPGGWLLHRGRIARRRGGTRRGGRARVTRLSRPGGGTVKRGRLGHPSARSALGLGRLGRGPGHRLAPAGLADLGGHCDRQSCGLADGPFDIARAVPARERRDHRFDREEDHHAGAVHGAELAIAPHHRPGDAADGGEPLHHLGPPAAQHVGVRRAGGAALPAAIRVRARLGAAVAAGTVPTGAAPPPVAAVLTIARGTTAPPVVAALVIARAAALSAAFPARALQGGRPSLRAPPCGHGTGSRRAVAPLGSVRPRRRRGPGLRLCASPPRRVLGARTALGRPSPGSRLPIAAVGAMAPLPRLALPPRALQLLTGLAGAETPLALGAPARSARGGVRANRRGLVGGAAADQADGALQRPLRLRGGDGHQDAAHQELQLQARGGRASHRPQRLVDQVGGARQALGTPVLRLQLHPLELVGGGIGEDIARPVARDRDYQQVPQALEQVLDEAPRVVPGLDHALHDPVRAGPVATGQGVHRLVEQRRIRVPQERHRSGVGDLAVDGARHELVEHAQGVAHRPPAAAHHHRQHAVADADALLGAQLLQVRAQHVGRHQPERVVVGARADRADDALGLSRGEHELHVLGGLLHQFEQCVEALVRHHVGLVDDEDLVAVAHGRESGALAQVPGVVHAAVGGRVDLDDVQGARAARRQLLARGALAARRVRGPLRAVEAARQDTRGRRLAAAARAREQVGVRHSVRPERRLQRLRHVFLADHLVESVGAVPAVQSCRHPSRVDGGGGVRVPSPRDSGIRAARPGPPTPARGAGRAGRALLGRAGPTGADGPASPGPGPPERSGQRDAALGMFRTRPAGAERAARRSPGRAPAPGSGPPDRGALESGGAGCPG